MCIYTSKSDTYAKQMRKNNTDKNLFWFYGFMHTHKCFIYLDVFL